VLIVRMKVGEGNEARAAEVIPELARASRGEPGCELYIPCRDPEDPRSYVFYEQYRDHAEEQGVELPDRPLLFAKWPNTLIASGEPIRIPAICEHPDYEAELGVVIGRRASRVSGDDALDVVRGYVVANDVSGRDLQFADGQWVRGKSLDTFLPVGDLVPASEVPDPQALPIRAILNGETMQDSNTSNQIFGVAEVISFVTQAITLEPGDLIITGTPAGVGAFRKPPVWLQPGDEITIEIDGVGSITNPVTAA
jgi:2-keto-4-pentenoate hydratase/2-oxohepta-3-ene-1,7-dioic acid hydratase in catechol pathway